MRFANAIPFPAPTRTPVDPADVMIVSSLVGAKFPDRELLDVYGLNGYIYCAVAIPGDEAHDVEIYYLHTQRGDDGPEYIISRVGGRDGITGWTTWTSTCAERDHRAAGEDR